MSWERSSEDPLRRCRFAEGFEPGKAQFGSSLRRRQEGRAQGRAVRQAPTDLHREWSYVSRSLGSAKGPWGHLQSALNQSKQGGI